MFHPFITCRLYQAIPHQIVFFTGKTTSEKLHLLIGFTMGTGHYVKHTPPVSSLQRIVESRLVEDHHVAGGVVGSSAGYLFIRYSPQGFRVEIPYPSLFLGPGYYPKGAGISGQGIQVHGPF